MLKILLFLEAQLQSSSESLFVATLAFFADPSVLFHFFRYLLVKFFYNGSEILQLCSKIGACVTQDLI
jgi:hypothetical protein